MAWVSWKKARRMMIRWLRCKTILLHTCLSMFVGSGVGVVPAFVHFCQQAQVIIFNSVPSACPNLRRQSSSVTRLSML